MVQVTPKICFFISVNFLGVEMVTIVTLYLRLGSQIQFYLLNGHMPMLRGLHIKGKKALQASLKEEGSECHVNFLHLNSFQG